MARSKKTVDALLDEMRTSLQRLVDAARSEGREDALAELRGVLGGASPKARGSRSTKRAAREPQAKKPAGKKKRKNPWANLTDEQRLARINAIRKGKGLKPRKSLDD